MNEVFIGVVSRFSNQDTTKTSSQEQLDKSDKGNNEKVKPKTKLYLERSPLWKKKYIYI